MTDFEKVKRQANYYHAIAFMLGTIQDAMVVRALTTSEYLDYEYEVEARAVVQATRMAYRQAVALYGIDQREPVVPK